MKIKWKIVLSSVAIIISLTLSIVLFTYGEVNKLVKENTLDELKNYSNMGLEVIDSKYSGDWNVKDEILYKGEIVINDNYEVIDSFAGGTDVIATLFMNDTRVSTNVSDETGKRLVGTTASEEVINTVLINKEPYSGEADILGKSAQTYYVPIKDVNGNVVGMWFVGVYTNIIREKINSIMILIVTLSVVILSVGIAVSYMIGTTIANTIELIQTRIKLMETGDFSFDFDDKLLKRKDEIGGISNSSKHMKERIAEIVKGIQNESISVKNVSKESSININNIHSNIEDISATTEELSAGMEETSASTEEIFASTHELESEVNMMKDKSSNGDILANEIKNRAEDLKVSTNESYKKSY